MKNQSPVLEISNLSKSVDKNQVLSSVSLSIREGEIYALLGKNGAGKTTLMKTIFNILKKDTGQVKFFGQETSINNDNSVFRNVGSIIETPIFYCNLSAVDNLEIHCDYIGKELKSNIPNVLKMVGLNTADISTKKVRDFSLGMKQRLGLARAFLSKPKLLILDEPINGLDPIGIKEIRELILDINQKHGTSILISSHIISEIDKIASVVGIINEGCMVEETTIEIMRDKTGGNIENYFYQSVLGGSL
ncbi:ATP-binding cassette domain-containing protein [Enterococcus sp. AZ196]|uniref:ATP-binding cassette domain-containing protein n=1 Tax=Enterococcus sp. AZ196 TaxID=2774659 RepID=UPI003D2B2D70